MKYSYILLTLALMGFSSDGCIAQSSNENYILSRNYRSKSASVKDGESLIYWGSPLQVQTQISYLDGLGKEKRNVAISANPMQRDLSASIEYNTMFQPVKQYLPIALKPNTETPITQSYYNSTKVGNPTAANYTESIYEPSPLGRVQEVKSPGVGTGVKKRYLVNGAGIQTVIRYYINAEGNLVNPEAYPDNSLLISETSDENGKKVEEFTDYNDRVILKRVAGEEDTYYVYDGKGQLRFVLQPQFQVGSASVSDKLNNFAFQYTYDSKGRMNSKRIPGQGTISMEYYDSNNMLHYLVDAKGQKFYYNYDALNRQTEMGMVTSQGTKPLLKTKYDNYDNIGETFDNSAYSLTDDDHFIGSPKTDSKKGLVTMTSTRVLDGGDTWLNTVMFYDKKGRVVQTQRGLYDLGGASKEIVSYKLDFVGNILEERTEQFTNTIRYRFDKVFVYDHQNRLRRVKHTLSEVNSSGTAEIKKTYKHVANTYNEIGLLETKFLHKPLSASSSDYIQKLSYQYTPRGWLYGINTTLGKTYGIDLRYNENGNINNFGWRTSQGDSRSFSTISYDASNRLIEASGNEYKERNITYDKNGNIKTLKREGTVNDNLTYIYKNQTSQKESNRLEVISNSGANGLGVKNGDSGYQYDANGNMVSDGNKGVAVTYNELNLPSKVEVTGPGRTVNYVYDGAGNKLKMEAPGVTTFYAGAFEYNTNKSLLRVGLEEGQLTKNNSGNYELNYYLRDHLGNVRMVLKEDGTVLQETEYYAFGLPVTKTGNDAVNRYIYNGKEKQPETGWLDYKARSYMPELGRWGVVDPNAEKYEAVSAYAYGFNNPTRFIDLKGKDPGDVIVLFSGANLNPFDKDPYGITRSMKNMLSGNLSGGNVEKFLSNYVSIGQNNNGYDNSVYLQHNLDDLTQDAYDYIKSKLEGNGRIGIYGYSWGGVLANHLAQRLDKEGLSIDLLIMVDAANSLMSHTVNRLVPSNVSKFENIYQENPSGIGSRGYPASKTSKETKGNNIRVNYVKDEKGKLVKASHTNIDDDQLKNTVDAIINQFNRNEN